MHVKLLGSSAGGGLPQWNCRCDNCRMAMAGELTARTQSSVAFSADGKAWFLINASPDIRFQLAALPDHSTHSSRARPFEAILLSNGDLDHTLGLLIVREGGPPTVYCTPEVQVTLTKALGFERILGAFIADGAPGIDFRPLGSGPLELSTKQGNPTGLSIKAIPLGGSAPRYDAEAADGTGHASAFVIKEENTGANFVCALDVPERNEALLAELARADLAIIDGTFWSDGEMIELGFSARTSTQMGHWPISGPEGSLTALTSNKLGKGLIVYSHINNTNPILNPASEQAKAVAHVGIRVGIDGLEWTL